MTSRRDILEPLRSYAQDSAQDVPPQILPWDSSAPWALDGAARKALGLLVAGEGPGQRLYEMADYLLTFCVAADRSRDFPDALLLNGTALALCGYLCDGHNPEAHIWRITGAARLATEMHARKAALENRIGADCLLAVCRMADETGLPILADLITLRERMWGRLLDHSRAEMLHVPEAAYPSYMQNPVPVEQVGELMRTRPWQQKARAPEYMLHADIAQAEQTINNLLTLHNHMLVRYQFGSEIDWYLRLLDDLESTVSLNTQRCIGNHVACYIKTGDERYARDAARLLWSWYNHCPIPNYKHPLGPWRTLEVGGRVWYTWMDMIGWLGQTAAFDEATHSMLARSRYEHMRYLMAFCGGPNNWYQVEACGMAVCALYSPELKDSDVYLRVALRRLKWINSFAYFDDGFQFELSHGYHMFPTNALFALARAAKARGVTLPRDFMALDEKANEMYLFSAQPDHLLPTFNDSNTHPTDPSPTLRVAAEVFGRDDLLWGGTYGKQGTPPDHASHAWPSAGYYVMRDRWGEDGQHFFFDGAPWGASHQHEDKLSFTLYSHGRLLIGDPNIYSYSPTELTHYFKASRGHNVVMVDGRGQARRYLGQRAWLKTQGRNEWVSRPGFDFVSSEYMEGYAPDPYPAVNDPSQVDMNISQRRAIFYVKPGYWILCDLLRGQDKKAHVLEQIFHIAPLFALDTDVPLRAGEVSATPVEIVMTNPGVANIAILPADTRGVSVRAQKGETSPAVGWFGVEGEFPAWDVTLQRSTALPARMDAVLFPLAPGQTTHPTVTRLLATDEATALRIVGDGIDDTFILCEEGAGPVSVDGVTFKGRAALVQRHGALRGLAVQPVTLKVDGRDVAAEV